MDREKAIDLLNRMKAASAEQGVDFADVANAYTVWADLPNGIQFCGGRATRESANLLAFEHVHLTALYIVRTSPLAIEPVDDSSRIGRKD
jgi:hypothetical protein